MQGARALCRGLFPTQSTLSLTKAAELQSANDLPPVRNACGGETAFLIPSKIPAQE